MPEPPLPVQFRAFGASAARDGCATYGAICAGVSDDAEILALLDGAPPSQRRPNLLLGAVHSLLLGGVDHPLGAFYDTVSGTGPPPGQGVYPAFRDFCLTHRADLLELVATRSTQTNEVGRCSILLPALCAISLQHAGAPISLLDLGASAGLNLLFDTYGYTYTAVDDGTTQSAGVTDASVQLRCDVRGPRARLPALATPSIADRAGLDLEPIDASSPQAAQWLLACLWPDNLERFNRLRAALELWRTTVPTPPLHAGDMVDDLELVAGTVGNGEPLVVFHSWAVAYLTETRQRELVTAVHNLGTQRPVHHLYAELPFETPGLPMPEPPEEIARSNAATALIHIGPGRDPERWANVHPHGRWIRWWGPC